MHLVDEAVLDRIGSDVDQLVQQVLGRHHLDDARLFAGPHIFPSAAKRVLRLGHQLVEVLAKLDVPAVSVVGTRVVMVGHHLGQDDVEAKALRRFREQVRERVVGLLIRPQQKLTLRATTLDRQELAGKHGTWRGHGRLCQQVACQRGSTQRHLPMTLKCPVSGRLAAVVRTCRRTSLAVAKNQPRCGCPRDAAVAGRHARTTGTP